MNDLLWSFMILLGATSAQYTYVTYQDDLGLSQILLSLPLVSSATRTVGRCIRSHLRLRFYQFFKAYVRLGVG